MKTLKRPALPVLIMVMLALAAAAGFSQGVPPQSVDGTVSAMTATSLTLTAADGSEKSVSLPPGVLVLSRTTATLSDIRKGDAMGVTAHRAEGGMLTATEINIFSRELWRVVRKGQFPMQQPGQIMTNALVTGYDAKASGHTLSMRYGDFTTKIDVPDATVIHRLTTEKLSAVKQGMHILVRGTPNADGTFKAATVSFEG